MHTGMRVPRDVHICAVLFRHLPNMQGVYPGGKGRNPCLGWALVQTLGAVLQGHDCVSRAQTPLPHVFRGTCFVANSLFVNNCRDVAESPRCGREPAGIQGWFCPVVTRALLSAGVGFLRDTPNSHSKLLPCSCLVTFAPLHWVETEAGSAQARL